jgi:DNA helicase-2/ATP-dependent DNA helicase PcrA
MTGLEQGVFPRGGEDGDDLEEERRLFYVGATRAMDELYLSSCALRRMYGRTQPMLPSPFLREADSSALRVIGARPGGFGGKPAGGLPAGGRISAAAPKIKTSSDGRWTLGDRLFHDDQGYGYITGIKEGEDGPVIQVAFENGYRTSFLSRGQSGNFTKIGSDG